VNDTSPKTTSQHQLKLNTATKIKSKRSNRLSN